VSDVVEQYTIRPIPDGQRHGTARSLFPFCSPPTRYLLTPRGAAPSAAAGRPAAEVGAG
jgi:hypothetical protein